MRKHERLEQTLKEAWIGDAVLCLYARSKILLEDGLIESDKFVRMTSNKFLGVIGEASEVEAKIGRVYQRKQGWRHRHRVAPRDLFKAHFLVLKFGRNTVSNPISGRKAHTLYTVVIEVASASAPSTAAPMPPMPKENP